MTSRRPTQTERARERREAESTSGKVKLTPKEQEEKEEKEFEDACEKWLGKLAPCTRHAISMQHPMHMSCPRHANACQARSSGS